MKGFIEIETQECEKVLVAVSQIRCVNDGEKCRTIHFVCEEDKGIRTDESYEEICNKIRDALSEGHKETEDPWEIMNLLFKAMHEKKPTTATWEWFEERSGRSLEDDDDIIDLGWRCSHCKTPLEESVGGYWDEFDNKPDLKFCPECGERMVV